jgi:hypothetical protein
MTTKRKTKRCRVTRKLCYDTEEEAGAQLFIMQKLGPVWRHEQRAYYCKHCNNWHLTSQRPKEEEAK